MDKENTKTASVKEESYALDDARRVKVLSPSMMVFKRFVRNKLAIVGFIILVTMFLFSFVGPLFMPYTSAQLFTYQSEEWKTYATGKYNTDPRYLTADGVDFPSSARTAMLLAISNAGGASKLNVGDTLTFVDKDVEYTLQLINSEGKNPTYVILSSEQVATGLSGKLKTIKPEYDTPEIREALEQRAAQKDKGANTVQAGGINFTVSSGKKEIKFYALGSPDILVTYDTYLVLDNKYVSLENSFEFGYELFKAAQDNVKTISFNGETFQLTEKDNEIAVSVDDKEILMVSDIAFGAFQTGVELSSDFLVKTSEIIRSGGTGFRFTAPDGTDMEARINLVNGNYYVETRQDTQLLLTNQSPSSEHLLGTDNHGMDLLTRLMYGGRVSLLVGFVVVFFEVFLGVIVGGVSGYFGGWVDTLLMRLVDLVNAIPFYPTIIIIGAVLDHMKVSAVTRLFLLMVVMGILGWTGVARVVRGQILSLREQDYMVATEATGLRTGRRIFKHLVPNVMPLLIVDATMSLGSVILTEATLGFLGLGVKYPMASWGSIINQATDMYVMTNAWWIWIPAGFLILITVLGFNFVGDGLRDAFDPRMKR